MLEDDCIEYVWYNDAQDGLDILNNIINPNDPIGEDVYDIFGEANA